MANLTNDDLHRFYALNMNPYDILIFYLHFKMLKVGHFVLFFGISTFQT